METVTRTSVPLGEILVSQNILSKTTVDRVASMAKKANRRVGMVLEDLGLVTEEELVQALARQFGYAVVQRFADRIFPPELLGVVPAEIALRHQVFPLKLEAGRLALAMADPADEEIISAIASSCNVTVVPFIGPRQEIVAAICRHYFGKRGATAAKPSLLVIDDDKTLLILLLDIFASDYQVTTARNGREGYLEALSCAPSVILTDLEMPVMDGFAVQKALKDHPEMSGVPVILMSGRGEPEDEEIALDSGFFDFISKPFSLNTIQTRVKRALQFSGRYRHLPSLGRIAAHLP